MKKLFFLIFFFSPLIINAQSGIYDELIVGFDVESKALTGVFKLTDYQANGKENTCKFYIVGTLEAENKPFTVNLYSLDYQLLGYGEMRYSPKSVSYHLSLEKNIGQCNQIMRGFVGEGFEFYQKYGMDWKAVRLVKSPKAYFYSLPKETSKGKAYIIKGDWVGITKMQYNWIYADYITPNTKKFTKVWIKKSDLIAE